MLFVLIIFSSLCYATSPLPKILLVDDDSTDDNSYRSYYTDALDTNGYSYDTFKVDDTTGDNGPQYSQMQNYDIVVWFTGESSDTLTDTDIGNLTAYFDNGGNLFLSSIYAGLDISTHPSNFYKNYLHAIYNSQIYKNDVRSTDLNSYINNPISDSLSVKLDFNVHSSDQISSINTYDGGAYVYNIQVKFKIFRFLISKSKTVAINADNQTFKVVYLGLGLESVITPSADKTSEQIRAEMMNNIMNYLYTPNTTISDIDPLYTSANTTIYADCYDPERFSYINATEYYIDTNDLGDGNNTPMNPSDGSFNTNTEEANITISTTGLSNGNHTVFIHCQDKDGHWGKYDNMTFWVDRTQPPAPSLEIKDTSGYTNTEIVSLNLTTTGPINGTNLYYIAFSCNDSAFTDDYTIYESDQNGTDYLTYHINLTDTGIGCSTADGPRTIHIRAKSRANVENTTHNTDTTILDRIPPSFTSVNVSDPDTYYKAGDTITLDINMGEPSLVLTANLSALSTDSINFPPIQNLTDDGDNTYSFTTSPLNPATMLEGLKTIKITATDRAGNSPVS
ncbi:MAG: hypothetical protein U9P44_01825, partial [archaeon]|nr:hypothetical protein [archaeon]